jgi:pyroglutamyl-peptidase
MASSKTQRVLLTSFDIWEPHHISNASDDLLAELIQRNLLDDRVHLLRKLPVDFELAPQQVCAEIERLQPEVVICCGMAEQRSQLTIETNGKYQEKILETSIAVESLVETLTVTTISHDAGSFVCNHLYYAVLEFIQGDRCKQSIFIHVPILNQLNLENTVNDFKLILQWLINLH